MGPAAQGNLACRSNLRERAPKKIASARFLGRGAASIGAKPRGTQRLAKFAPLRRSGGKPSSRDFILKAFLILASSSGRWRAVQHLCWRRDGGSKRVSVKAWFCPRKFQRSSPLGEGAFRLRSFGPRNGRGGHFPSFGKKICSSGRGVALNRLTICIEYCIIIETMPNYTPYAKGAIRIDVKKITQAGG